MPAATSGFGGMNARQVCFLFLLKNNRRSNTRVVLASSIELWFDRSIGVADMENFVFGYLY